MAAPVLRDIVRRHAEQAAHLWCVFDWHLLHPDENPDMDADRMDRLIERLNAHLDALRIAGDEGREIAQDRFDEFPEAGELFVLRMLHASARNLNICDLDLDAVREYLAAKLPSDPVF